MVGPSMSLGDASGGRTSALAAGPGLCCALLPAMGQIASIGPDKQVFVQSPSVLSTTIDIDAGQLGSNNQLAAIDEGLELAGNFRDQHVGFELVHQGAARHRCERREGALSEGLEALAQRPKGGGECKVQADRHPRRLSVERIERARLCAVKAWRYHHRGGGIEASAHHEIADGGVDGGRNAEVVGAQPDAPALRAPDRGHV